MLVLLVLSGGEGRLAQTSDDEIATIGPGVTAPVPIKTVKGVYTDAARKAKIEGVVLLRAVVRKDGTIGLVSVERSLDPKLGLDEAAIAAARQWVFEPAKRQKDKQPVAVRVTIEMAFGLKSSSAP